MMSAVKQPTHEDQGGGSMGIEASNGSGKKGDDQEIILFVSRHLEGEPFFDDLNTLGLPVVRFPDGDKRWRDPDIYGIYILHELLLLEELGGMLDLFFLAPERRPVLVIGERIGKEYLASLFGDRPYFHLSKPISTSHLRDTINRCRDSLDRQKKHAAVERELDRAQQEINELHAIGIALSSEKDPDRLLDLILTKSRQISAADAGSLYLREGEHHLRFKLTQNNTLDWQASENLLMPCNDASISGYVALTGNPLNLLDVYVIPPSFKFTFNQSFDKSSGYRSKSMLVVPMKNQAGEVLGVIQLINKNADFSTHRPGQPLDPEKIMPFTRNDVNLLSSLASQAAIALENNKLYQDIQNLFEGFVRASVVAIESRDPTTFGHSERVASLTVSFARKLSTFETGRFANVRFSDTTLTEIRYASLLHDFGKVGVREEVLIKAKKLFPWELTRLKERYRLLRKSLEADHNKRCLEYVLSHGVDKYNAVRDVLEAGFIEQLTELQQTLDFLLAANEPTVLEEGDFNRLREVAARRHVDGDGQVTEFLNEREMHVLSIRKGSLSEEERREIESHVTHTFNFLSKIPWTKSLRRVPEIAFAHHEKLNGRGYPNHIEANAIPLESKLMTIADIFDALTATDRPYKKALPRQKAFDIMYNEVTQGLLDRDLLDIFVQGEVFKVIDGKGFEQPTSYGTR